MSLETKHREPSRCLTGEGCHVPSSNSQEVVQNLGGVGGGDRTGKADRVSREDSGRESMTRRNVQGGEPTEAARTAGVVGVPRSSVDLPDIITGGERRWGTWVHVTQSGKGSGDGWAHPDKNSNKGSGAAAGTLASVASPMLKNPRKAGCGKTACPV